MRNRSNTFMPEPTPELVISIVSYNTRADLEACLRSLFLASIDTPFQAIVIDNGSTDGSQEMVRSLFPQVKLIETGENLGYGRANNRALIGHAGKYYLILNSDIVLEPGSVLKLVDHLHHCEGDGAAMGALVNPDGTAQTTWAAGELTVASILWEQTFLSRLFPKSPLFGAYFQTFWDHDSPRYLRQACGAFLLLRSNLFNSLGGFDPAYFMYCEDTDLSRRIRDAGFEIAYVPEARAAHGHGKSSEGRLRPQMIFEHNKSRCYYLKKFAGPGPASSARRIMLAGSFARFFFWAVMGLASPKARTRARGFAYVFRATARMKI